MALKPQRSLKARALQWLAQREQSRTELRRKLMPHARAEFSAHELADREAEDAFVGASAGADTSAGVRGRAPGVDFDPMGCGACRSTSASAGTVAVAVAVAATAADRGQFVGASPVPQVLSAETRVEAVLDWLEAHQYLSQARFVESRIHARAPRFGNLRIRHELKQHQAVLSPQAAQDLKDSELQRACAVRSRKFSASPGNATERARQGRFLIGRGFSHEIVRRALRDLGDVGDVGEAGEAVRTAWEESDIAPADRD